MRLAVIGSGISGLVCAHSLQKHHDVVLFEAASRLGGHANTVSVEDPAAGELSIDTGFIVHNDRNYPNLVRLFSELGVVTQDTEMSFAVTDRPSGFSYRATNLNSLFADRRNLVDPRMWRMLTDILRFYRDARRYLTAMERPDAHQVGPMSMAEFIAAHDYREEFIDLHLVPMGAAVWSADPTTFDRFPAESLLRFLANHGLLGVGQRPQWRTVVGGSKTYVDAIEARFSGEIRRSTPVRSVFRAGEAHSAAASPSDRHFDNQVIVEHAGGREPFDRVILACHSDQALRLISDATPAEKEVLGAIGYQANRATLHTDIRRLSDHPRAWAAWNYERHDPEQTEATVTYDLTALQRLPGSRRYLVSLNSDDRINDDQIIRSFDYSHPTFDRPAIDAQQRFDEVDGVSGLHFCGAYWGHGFHEDGMVSALRVCDKLSSADLRNRRAERRR